MLVLSLLVLSFAIAPSGAQAAAFASYSSGVQVQNLEDAPASITLAFYAKDCVSPCTPTYVYDSITNLGSKNFFPLPGVTSGFNGSLVISSNTKVASISNISGGSNTASGSYVALSGGSTSVTLPVLEFNNGATTHFYSWFNVQNAGSSDAHVDVSYSDGTSIPTVTIAAGSSHTFDQMLESHPTKAFFAATITSDVDIVATVLIENSNLIQAYTGFGAGSLNPVMPLINIQPTNKLGNLATGVAIANTGGSSTDVTVSYTPSSNGTACTETQTILSHELKVFALAAFKQTIAGENCVANSTFVGTAEVTANTGSMPLAIVVNQNQGTRGSSYNGFDPGLATGKVVAPLIMDHNNATYLLWTSLSIMNVGSVDTPVTCTFTNQPTKNWVISNLAHGTGTYKLTNNYFTSSAATPYVGSATCTASASGAQIIGIVNEQSGNSAISNDWTMSYEAINVAYP